MVAGRRSMPCSLTAEAGDQGVDAPRAFALSFLADVGQYLFVDLLDDAFQGIDRLTANRKHNEV